MEFQNQIEVNDIHGKSNMSRSMPTFLLAVTAAGVGLMVFYLFTFKPLYSLIVTYNWTETPCEIKSASVKEDHSWDYRNSMYVTKYSFNVAYVYGYEGKSFRSNSFYFTGTDSRYSSWQRLWQRKYTDAVDPVCYVNPKNPEESVLELGFKLALIKIIWGPIILLFAAMLFSEFKRSAKIEIYSCPGKHPFEKIFRFDKQQMTCKPASYKGFVFVVFLVIDIMILLNIFDVIYRYRAEMGWKLKGLIMIPFSAMGLLTVYWFIRYVLLPNSKPVPYITLRPGVLSYGEPVSISWKWKGSLEKLKKLRILLVGEYSHNQKDQMSKNNFHKSTIFKSETPLKIASCETVFKMPDKISIPRCGDVHWFIEIEAETDSSSDVNAVFLLPVKFVD